MSGEQPEPTDAPVLAEAFGFDAAVEAMREHESGFADLYDNAKPWQRLMLSGANLAGLGESVADKAATGAAGRIQHFHQRLAQDENVGGRPHGHLSLRPRTQWQAVRRPGRPGFQNPKLDTADSGDRV